MKTTAAPENGLSESGINARLNHKSFHELSEKTPFTKAKKIVRKVDKNEQGLYAMLGIEDYTSQTKVSVHPEFVVFAYHLYGVSRKLLMYIIFFEMNNDNGRFMLTTEMMQRFRRFSALFGEKDESDSAIMQARRNLVRKNTMIQVGEEEYMLNPLIAGGSNENKRRKMIDAYSAFLKNKGLDTAIDFYPRYSATH
ncbi:MAG: hypothetical protein ACXVBX_16465 [Flavisolibacter sp.]